MENIYLIIKLIKNQAFKEAKELINKTNFNSISLYYYYMGLCSFSEKEYKIATEYFLKAKEHGNCHYLLYYNLGTSYLHVESYDNAICFLKMSLYKKNDYEKSYINLSYAYYKVKDYKKAYITIKSAAARFNSLEVFRAEKNLFAIINGKIKEV